MAATTGARSSSEPSVRASSRSPGRAVTLSRPTATCRTTSGRTVAGPEGSPTWATGASGSASTAASVSMVTDPSRSDSAMRAAMDAMRSVGPEVPSWVPTSRTMRRGVAPVPRTRWSTRRCTQTRAGWNPAATMAAASTSGTSSLVRTGPSPATTARYVATTPAVSSAHTRARLTTRSRPHSRWRSTATSTAPGKKSCDARCSPGVNHTGSTSAASSVSASGRNARVSNVAPIASHPKPRRCSGERRQRIATPRAARSPSAVRAPICHRKALSITSTQAWLRRGNGTEGSPRGHGYGSVTRTRTSEAVMPTPAATARPAHRPRGLSRTSQGTMVTRASVPGTHPHCWADGRGSSRGRVGSAASRIVHWKLIAASPPPTAVSARIHPTGCDRRDRISQATVP